MFLYYQYVDKYHVRPTTLEDLINGLLYLKAESSIKELYSER